MRKETLLLLPSPVCVLIRQGEQVLQCLQCLHTIDLCELEDGRESFRSNSRRVPDCIIQVALNSELELVPWCRATNSAVQDRKAQMNVTQMRRKARLS